VIKSANEDPCYEIFSIFKYFHFLISTKFHKCSVAIKKLKKCGHFREIKNGGNEGTFTSEPLKCYVNSPV
jgi:hypothetical protein